MDWNWPPRWQGIVTVILVKRERPYVSVAAVLP